MSKSIAVVGAGPGLGRSVARRYAREGYTVALVARHQGSLDALAGELANDGVPAHTIRADLSASRAGGHLAESLRAVLGATPDVLYYGPGMRGNVAVADLTAEHLRVPMGLALYALVDLVHEFLPDMLDRRHGAILVTAGASAVVGMPQLSGTAVLGAQRNYLQALQAAVSGHHVRVGRLYVGAMIERSAFHSAQQEARAAGRPIIDLPVVHPDHLADLLWKMQGGDDTHEIIYPPDLFEPRASTQQTGSSGSGSVIPRPAGLGSGA